MNEGDRSKRIVLPQWLASRRASEMREAHAFAGTASTFDYEPSLSVFRELLSEFRENPSPFAATDLMGVAMVLGQQAETEELAEHVLNDPITGPVAQTEALTILRRLQTVPDLDERSRIRAGKSRTAEFPRDAHAWIDQARLYTILGQYAKARRAVLAALHLAPFDRTIVRAAIRFFAHHNDWDEALFYAKRAYSQNADPMLLGPLVSIGTQLDKLPVRLRSTADAALKADDRFLYSEVLAAVGTFELLNGAGQRSKKFFKRAWQDPTKAVVSQSQWVLREHLPGLAREQEIDFRQSAEAMSWLRYAVLDFKGALARAHEWVLEEPYSRSAHDQMSGIATLIDDYETATKAAERGLQANPGDLRLHNNLAFAQLRMGDVVSAQHTFEPLMAVLHDPERIAEMATYGLLQMSLGLHAEGVAAYETAIRRATEVSDSKTVVRAALNLAISEFDVLHSVDPDLIRQTIAHVRDVADPQSIGTAMSLARRLMHDERMESEDVATVGKEFVEAVREGAGKLVGSLFAESVDRATSEGSGNREQTGESVRG